MADVQNPLTEKEFADSIISFLKVNEFANTLGLEFQELSLQHTVGRMRYSTKVTNPYMTIHGGALYSLADIVAGAAACMNGNYCTTVEGALNYLEPAGDTEYVYCTADCVKAGRRLIVMSVRLTNDAGTLLDTGTFTFYVTPHSVIQ